MLTSICGIPFVWTFVNTAFWKSSAEGFEVVSAALFPFFTCQAVMIFTFNQLERTFEIERIDLNKMVSAYMYS